MGVTAEMKPYERVMRRLRGEPVDRPPNFDIMMTFAARYIGQPLSHYYQDYRVLCQANLAVQQDFKLDLVQAISDPYRETADFGAQVEFPHNDLPICKEPLITEPGDLRMLKVIQPGWRMTDRLEAIRYLRAQVKGEVPIMGWVEGALAEAADLRGVTQLMMDFYDQPDWLKELLEICVQVEINFARLQVETGADIIGLGDAIASQISPELYAEFALPYEQRIFSAVRELGAIPRLHICGNTTRILGHMAQSGAAIIDIDWMVSMAAAAQTFGDRAAVCGNFDPLDVMLRGTPDDVEQATRRCMIAGGERCISAAGCEIPADTPHENLRAQAHALAAYYR